MQDDVSGAAQSFPIVRVRGGLATDVRDALAVEEPLEIRVLADGVERAVTVTMRTPGADAELAVGFLHAEGVVSGAADVATIAPCAAREGVLRVTLVTGRRPDFAALERRFVATSSCGVCGRASVDAVLESVARSVAASASAARAAEDARRRVRAVRADVLQSLPARLRGAQPTFAATGGLHAVAAFDEHGRLLAVREDVGRHNALDKLVGAALLSGAPDLQRSILLLSGRAGFEMVQKALIARVPILAAIGAPSSLAVELAVRGGITLVGFARESGFNVYSGAERIVAGQARDLRESAARTREAGEQR